MPQIDEQALKNHIKEKLFLPVYFVYGQDAFLLQHYVSEIAKKSVDAAFYDTNYELIDGKKLDVDELSEKAEQLPFMSDRRCIVVKDFDAESATETQMGKLKELLSDPPPTCVMVFYNATVEFDYKRPGKFRSLITAINKTGATVDLPYKSQAALIKMLVSSSKKRGSILTDRAAAHLISRCGADLLVLQKELDKLCAYKRESEILAEDIDLLTTETLDATVWQMANAAAARDCDKALCLLDILIYNGSKPQELMPALISSYTDIYIAGCAIDNGMRAEDAAADFGYKDNVKFKLSNGAKTARNCGKKMLRAYLSILSDADIKMKSTSIDNRVIFEQMLVKLASA